MVCVHLLHEPEMRLHDRPLSRVQVCVRPAKLEVTLLLAAQFRHEIDPSYSGDKTELQAIHGVTRPTDAYRC